MTQSISQPKPQPTQRDADPTDPLAPHQPGELAPPRAPNPGAEGENQGERRAKRARAASESEDVAEPIDDADVIAIEDAVRAQAPETD